MKKAWKTALPLFACVILLAGCSYFQEPTISSMLEYRSAEGDFYTVFPGAPEYYTEKVETMFGVLDSHMYTYNTEDASFLISYMDYPEEYMSEDSAQEYYDSAKQAVLEGINGTLTEEKEIMLNQYPGREFTLSAPAKTVYTERIFFVKGRLYQQVVVTEDQKKYKTEMMNFFSHFNILLAGS
jgi:hypothetical protein